jgi:hypothetical protein
MCSAAPLELLRNFGIIAWIISNFDHIEREIFHFLAQRNGRYEQAACRPQLQVGMNCGYIMHGTIANDESEEAQG